MKLEEIENMFLEFLKIPSVTGSHGEEMACSFLEEVLEKNHIEYQRISKVKERPNLLAKITAKKATEHPLVFISHIDVVEGKQEEWTHPIFGAEVKDQRIWGRGTLDTKQLTMMQLYTFLNLKRHEDELNRDIWFLATIDEEKGSKFGMEYVKSIIPGLFKDAVVINEGGGFPLLIQGKNYMTVTMGEKAFCKVLLASDGKGGHASAPGNDQAILKLASGLKKIFQNESELQCGESLVFHAMEQITENKVWDNKVGNDLFLYAGKNDITSRNFKLGERSNVIASRTEIVLELKLLPGSSREDVRLFLEETLRGESVTFDILEFQNGFENSIENSQVMKMLNNMKKCCNNNGFEVDILPMLALGRTDGRFFGIEGSQVYGFSPLLMDDSFDVILPKVHGNDESISIDSFRFGCSVMYELMMELVMVGTKGDS